MRSFLTLREMGMAMEFFIANSVLCFKWGKYQTAVNGPWYEWWEIHIGKYFWGYTDIVPIRYGRI